MFSRERVNKNLNVISLSQLEKGQGNRESGRGDTFAFKCMLIEPLPDFFLWADKTCACKTILVRREKEACKLYNQANSCILMSGTSTFRVKVPHVRFPGFEMQRNICSLWYFLSVYDHFVFALPDGKFLTNILLSLLISESFKKFRCLACTTEFKEDSQWGTNNC